MNKKTDFTRQKPGYFLKLQGLRSAFLLFWPEPSSEFLQGLRPRSTTVLI